MHLRARAIGEPNRLAKFASSVPGFWMFMVVSIVISRPKIDDTPDVRKGDLRNPDELDLGMPNRRFAQPLPLPRRG